MVLRVISILLSFTVFTIACSSGKPSPEIVSAQELYEEVLLLETETHSIFDSLEQVMARDSTLAVYSDELTALKAEFDEWEETVVDMGEGGHEDHHHPHAHQPRPELTDQQLLDVQRESRAQLLSISERLSGLVERMMKH